MTERNAGVWGLGRSVPDRVLTNEDLEKMVDTSDEWIVTRTGISERRIAGDDVATSDLALAASRQALEQAGLTGRDVDMVIAATVTPDTSFPSTACLMQEELGAPGAAAFDLGVGCTGFVYGLAIAHQFVASGAADHVVVAAGDILSKITDWEDRGTCVLFGDAAGAAVVGPCRPGTGILSTYLGNDGSGAHHLQMPAGGSRRPASEETVRERLHYLKMNGREVFKFAVRAMSRSAREVVARAGLSFADIDCYIPHQANRRIIDASAGRLGIPMEKVYINLDRYGNTSAASVPLALSEAWDSGVVGPGDNVLAVTFGAGLSWAAAALRMLEESDRLD
ncbi:MAG: beta-ketoacyl-ACP synthase III [Bacillota bacterium]